MRVYEYNSIITGKGFEATGEELRELIPFLPVIESEWALRQLMSPRETYEWGTANERVIKIWEDAIAQWKLSKESA